MLSAEVDWLACRDKCIPGKASLELKLKTVAKAKDAQPANTKTFLAWADRIDPIAPEFTLKDQDGKKVSLSDLKGKVVVLEWFNPDCPFVKRHHVTKSTMVDLANKYAGKGVVWLAVNSTHYMGAKASKKASPPRKAICRRQGSYTTHAATGRRADPPVVLGGRCAYTKRVPRTFGCTYPGR
ncbi:MAG: redoxin domain-containing protein [Chloroflexi bacterium]|nr:redoxin domain-containing protein [Chloroflexota bacterium]